MSYLEPVKQRRFAGIILIQNVLVAAHFTSRENCYKHTSPRINILISFFAQSKLDSHDMPAPMVAKVKMFAYTASAGNQTNQRWLDAVPRIREKLRL